MVRRLAAPALLALIVTAASSCQAPPAVRTAGRRAIPGPLVSAIDREPRVRVRIVADAPRVTLSAPGPLVIGPIESQRGLTSPRSFAPPIVVTRRGGRFLLTYDHGRTTIAWGLPALAVRPASAGADVTVNGAAYPGALVVWPVRTKAGAVTDRLDVVNHVPMERYLPGVLEGELYGSWPIEAFVAQAIAARTYAIAEQALHTDRHYDLASTTASQVYRGRATNPKAVEAVRRTRGRVLVYAGRIVPAYFSSCAGGVGQDATAAFPDSPWVVDIPPLRGRIHGWGKSSDNYHWGPITRDRSALSRRIAAWGRANKNPVAGLGTIADARATRQSSTGRPAVFRVTDTSGHRFDLPAEWFRFACNYGGGQGALDRSRRLKSSNVEVAVRGGRVIFSNGRGFGHGVGLCQWSARDMAQAGYRGEAIVEFFYPGARVRRIY